MKPKSTFKEFWAWFADHSECFDADFENESLLKELDQRIVQMGSFTWEIGPGIKTNKRFVLSPGGDSLLLLQTEKIISYAPKIKGWEFYAAKPAKEWDLIFNYYTESGEKVKIDVLKEKYAKNKSMLKYLGDHLDELVASN